MIAEAQDLAAEILHLYPRCAAQGMRWLLVESGDRIMREVEDLGDFTVTELRRRGIEVLVGTRLQGVTEASVQLSDGQEVPARTIVWTGALPRLRPSRSSGCRSTSTAGSASMSTCRSRAARAYGPSAIVPACPIGAQVPCPPTAQHAMRQGSIVANSVAAALGVGERRRFTFKTLGLVVDLGRRRQAVAKILGIKLRGFRPGFAHAATT